MTDFDFFDPISEELSIVEDNLTKQVYSRVDLINQASAHLTRAGGKRLRPAFTLLAAKIYRDNLDEVIPMAIALELVHMATLIHDDVIDNSAKRRGTDTVKSVWGNRVSIFTGNYIFARSLDIVSNYERNDIINVMADASTKISEGEIIQMLSAFNVNLGLKNYFRRIERKTALLIATSCQLGAMVVNASPQEINKLRLYGYYLGMAFQVTDDILDFVADEKTLGKPVGSDIRQGVITLPALYALHHDRNKEELRYLLSSPEKCEAQAEKIISIIVDSGGIDYAYHVTQHFARKAQRILRTLPDVPVRQTFYDLANYILFRDY